MEFENLISFDPSSCLSGKVKGINRATANIFRKFLSPFNITDSQLSILFIFTKLGGLTQNQFSTIAHIEKSSLNRNLKRLFDRGYLSKNDFPIIEITQSGMALVNQIIPEWEKAMAEIRLLLGEDGEAALILVESKLLTKA